MKLLLYPLLLVICSGFGCLGQNYFSLTSPQTNKVYTGFEAVIDIAMKLHNATPSIKNYTWERTDICPMPSGWSGLVCDCDNCYNSQTYFKPSIGGVVDSCTIIFSYYFDLGASMGSHTTKLRVSDPSTTVAWDEIFLTINNGCPASLNEQSKASYLMVNLNSSAGRAYLQSMTESYGMHIVVNDMSGRVIKTHHLGRLTSGEKFYFDAHLQGIYLVNVYTNEGQKMGSYKMVMH